jgi:MATE family multidrug resistance protein
MYVSVASIPLKLFINWLLIFGNVGFTEMGSDGAGISTAVVSWFQLIVGFTILYTDPFYKRYNLRMSRPKLDRIAEILRLGLPMGASYLVEICSFTFITLFVAREGAYVSGGHQILSNLISFTYMIPMSIGIATAAIAARFLGARDWQTAHRSIMCGFGIALATAFITIAVVLLTKQQIIGLYSNDLKISIIAAGLLTFFPVIHVWDSMQCLNTYVLRAHKIATVPFILQTICLLGLGIGIGYYFGFGPGAGGLTFITDVLIPNSTTGLASLWLMNAVSLMVCSIVLFNWYWHVYKKSKV